MIREHIYKYWLRFVAVLLVIMAGSLTASAQYDIEGGEAFYIYQNDGHFDGFFYDQVQQISYSRLDTLGVEYDEYVSQEIVTADSTYRIMLTAIDSVSFVQPEIRYAKGVRLMRDEGMIDYYITCSDMRLAFDLSMPEALRPKVGDVLTCPQMKDYEGAFVGKVTNVKEQNGKLIAEWDYVKHYNEVFDQFITVEEVRAPDSGDVSKVRRRMAGVRPTTRYEGNFEDYSLLNVSADFEESWSWGNWKLSLASHLGYGLSYSLVYKITLSEFYVKSSITNMVETNIKASVDGQLGGEPIRLGSIPGVGKITKVPFPATVPIFYVDVLPTAFIRAEAHFNVGISTGANVKVVKTNFELMDHFPFISLGIFSLPSLSVEPKFNISAEINGMLQFGVMFPIEVGTQEWTKYFSTIKASEAVYAGPKISGNFTLADLGTAMTWWKGELTAYTYFKDMQVDVSLLSLDNEFSITMDGFWGSKHEKKYTKSISVGNKSLKLFPDIKDMKCDITGNKMNTVKATFNTSGDVFLPLNVGFALYNKENDGDEDYKKLYKAVYYPNKFFIDNPSSLDLEMNNVESGIYMIRPVVQLFSYDPIPVFSEEQLITIAPQEMELKKTEIIAEEKGGVYEIDIVASIDMPISCESNDSWIKAEVLRDVGGAKATILKVTVDPNDTYHFRTGTITVRQRFSTIETIERTVTVKQYGGLQLEPSSLSFGMEGGSQSVEILTSMSPITVNLNGANWLKYNLNGKHLVITADPNPSDARTANVTVAALSDEGFNGRTLIVEQAANTDPSVAHVSPTLLQFDAAGGTKDVKVYFGQYTRSGFAISNEGKDWVTVMNDGEGNMGVRVKANTTGAERTCTVTVYLTSSTADRPSADEMEAFPITVKQVANALEPGQIAMQSIASFTFTAAALMQDSKTGGTIRKEYTETFSSPDISFTQKGTTVHVQATKKYKDGYDSYQNLIEFDITSFGDNFVRAKIENLSFRHIYQDTYIDFTTPGLYGKSDDVEIELSGIDWQGSLSNYRDDQQSEFVFDGDVKTGVNFKKMTETKLYYSEETPKQYFNYVNSNDNSASLALQFTAKGESLARKQSTQQAAGNVTVGDITW